MRKKTLICGVIAATLTLSATMGGCSLVSSNANKDLEQTIATINISQAAKFDEELKPYKDAVGTTTVTKRELVSGFVNVGYSYLNYGYSAENVINMLADSLVNNAILTQYATMYLLHEKATNTSAEGYEADALSKYNAISDPAEKLEYLLGGKDSEDVKIAEYNLMSSLNAYLDSYEHEIIERHHNHNDSTTDGDTRSTPGNVGTEQDEYYPKKEDGSINYNVYTGYENYLLTGSGAYQDDAQEGTTRSTRIRAYNKYVSNLVDYNLVDVENENLRDIRSLDYVNNEYVSRLQTRVINKYYSKYEAEQEAKLKNEGSENAYEYVKAVYNDIFKMQSENYKTVSDFESAYGNISDTSFVLYAPDTSDKGTYGFVYNILLPFSATQSVKLTELQSMYTDSENGGYKPAYYTARNSLLKNIKTTDQREAWFNGSTEYAFNAKEKGLETYGASDWLFFEDNLTNNARYKELSKYAGQYSYNGMVLAKDEGYVLLPNELDINEMLGELKSYVNHIVGSDVVNYTTNESSYYKNYTADNLYKADGKKNEIDYENFVYATGKVALKDTSESYNRTNLFVKDTDNYKALSAVNELQYAYTTDTGVLSQYIGYSVNAGNTSYIKEFEYAAQEAIKEGAGTFKVCAGDYGWHLIYVTFTFDNNAENGAQYEFNTENIGVEGTFENFFYEWIKSNDVEDASSVQSNWIVTKYTDDSTVVKYEDRYKDLYDIA